MDDLIEGEDTSVNVAPRSMDIQLALKQEYKSRHLPATELKRFNGNLVFWPELIDNVYKNVHSKIMFLDNIKMTRLISLLQKEM